MRKDNAEIIYQKIKENPGRTPKELSKILGRHRNYVANLLPSLETHNLFTYEDANSRLYVYRDSNE